MADIHVFFKKSENRCDAYRLLEHAFERVFGIPAPAVEIDRNGKPYFPQKPDIHFSLSHSGEYVMCALSENNIGADIQKRQSVSDSMSRRVFTENELKSADALSLWCLKESFIKFRGKLDRDYRNMEFLKYGDAFCGPDNTQGILLEDIAGYAAAVCAEYIENINVSVL